MHEITPYSEVYGMHPCFACELDMFGGGRTEMVHIFLEDDDCCGDNG